MREIGLASFECDCTQLGSCSVLLDHVNLIIEMPHEIPVWPNLPFICYSYTYLHLLVLAPMPVLTEWSLRVLHFL